MNVANKATNVQSKVIHNFSQPLHAIKS